MAAPNTVLATVTLAVQYQNFINMYANMLSAANAFVIAGNLLSANPNITIATQAFQTAAVTVLNQVSGFLQTAPTTFPPAT